MSQIIPVPTTRITGLLTRQRLTQQAQNDQLDLFRIQEQISTGLRITLPSQDAPAALRAISFQRLLDRKEQLGSNINSGLQFLASTDASLAGEGGVANLLSQIKAETLGVVGTVATDQQRQAAIEAINGALNSLVTLGNRQFNGRYLFAGSQTSQPPYSIEDGNVIYHGDDQEVQNYSDIGVLFSSSISGQEVFGGISKAVEGQVDLDPSLNADTLLSSLRGGRGINANGSLQIADADTNSISIVDLSRATTVGDVVKLIEDNPPSGTQVNVSITGDGLRIELPGGNLVIDEVGTGTTARELGVLGIGSGVPSSITSEDLDPQLLKSTHLEDLLGSKARATVRSGGNNNDFLIEANQNGTALNGVTVEVFDGGDIGATATAIFNSGTNRLEIYVDDDGETTANHVVDAINVEGTFRAQIDLNDSSSSADGGTGEVSIGAFPDPTSGGTGETLDQTSGIRIVNGGETYDIIFDGDETVEDLLNRLNRSEAGLLAEINATGTGINIRSRLSGNDFQIGEIDGGTTAAQLGIRTYTADTKLGDFNFGVGVPSKAAFELNIHSDSVTLTTSDGQPIDVDFSAVTNLNEAINEINTDADNTGLVTAQQATDDDGNLINRIELIDNTTGLQRLTVSQSGGPIPVTGGIDLTVPAIDFNIAARDGTVFAIDVSNAKTVGDVLDLINGAAGNGGLVTAQLAASGNGIELVDSSGGGGTLSVTKIGGSQAAEFLGLVDKGEPSKSSVSDTLTGTDRNPLETDSVFNTLIRLRDALASNDLPAIERAAANLDNDIERVTFAQADVGIRFRSLELSQQNLQDEEIQLKAALSEEIDVDLVQALSDLTARQISLEASLRSTANILQLSLLNFI